MSGAVEACRRVVQCRCGIARAYRGDDAAVRAGWMCEWTTAGRRWICPDCYTPPPDPAPVEPPPFLLALVELGRDELAREQIELLLGADPPRGRATLEAVARWVRALRPERRGGWPGWLKERGAWNRPSRPRRARRQEAA